MTRIAFCGGGTGGHVMPAVAVLETLRQRCEVDAYLLGTSRPAERVLVDQFALTHVDLYGAQRSAMSHLGAFMAARRTLSRLRPDVAIGLGGYASVGGILAARSLGIRTVLLEQNAVPGRATSLLSKIAANVYLGLPVSRGRLAAELLGTPVRTEIAKLASLPTNRVAGCREILVLGGSQGSRVVSDSVLNALAENQESFVDCEFAHQAPADDVDDIAERYRVLGLRADVRPYFDDVPERLSRGPMVVSRAGGTTVAELACAGVPAVLIPHSQAFRDHQTLNARVAEVRNGAVLVAEHEIDRLGGVLAWLAQTPMARVRLAVGIRCLAKPEAALAVATGLGLQLQVGRKRVAA